MDAMGLGPRVPALVISPFSKPSYVSHFVYGFTSILRFAEKRFNLPNLTTRDKRADPMFVKNRMCASPPDSALRRGGLSMLATECAIQNSLMGDPEGRIESGFRVLHSHPEMVRVRAETWLGAEEPGAPAWDHYVHEPKKLDIVGLNAERKLVLCELKRSGGEGDNAPQQLRDYYLMLKADQVAQDHIRLLARTLGLHDIDFGKDVMLYVIVAGHVSRLLRERIRLLGPEHSKLFKVFQALPDNNDPNSSEWRCNPVRL